MNTTDTWTPAQVPEDHVLHGFLSSIGYEVRVGYSPMTESFYTWNAGQVARQNRNVRWHPNQAHALAFACNQILADVAAETGDTLYHLELSR